METKLWTGTVVWAIWLLTGTPIAEAEQGKSNARGISRVSDSRSALVIGNTGYDSGRLKNAVNDARAVKKTLSGLGFDVKLLENAGKREMDEAVNAFRQRLARRGGVGLFYYAGHGVQVQGENYLIPIGEKIRTEADIKYRSVPLGFLLSHLEEAGNGLNILILDACRENPFQTYFRTPEIGLAQTNAPTGTLIAYATGPGQVAADGRRQHGVFTEHLLEALRLPGLSIEEVLKKTRRAVLKETAGIQVPWTSSSLVGEFVPRRVPPRLLAGRIGASSGSPSFSLVDLKKQADQTAAYWNNWQKGMRAGFDETKNFEESASALRDHKVEAWEMFLATFGEDNPYSEDDQELRRTASARLDKFNGTTLAVTETALDEPTETAVEKPTETAVAAAETMAPSVPPSLPPRPPSATVSSPSVDLAEEAVVARVEVEDSSAVSGGLPPARPGAAWQDPGSGQRLRFVGAGSHLMGSQLVRSARATDESPHDVELSRGFWIMESEVTQSQWRRLMGTAPSQFHDCGGHCPVENVNWHEAVTYANRLSAEAELAACYDLLGCLGTPGRGEYTCAAVKFKGFDCQGYRLPTEAEWEKAAKPMETYSAVPRQKLDATAWYRDNSTVHYPSGKDCSDWDGRPGSRERCGPHVVAYKDANDWGVHDMQGNVWEWTHNWYSENPRQDARDPAGPEQGSDRVVRGGSWYSQAVDCRPEVRHKYSPTTKNGMVGFRLVRTASRR